MSKQEKISINGVPETMLQTMYARAKETLKPDAVIHDDKAVEIVEKLDYDFALADKDAPMGSGIILICRIQSMSVQNSWMNRDLQFISAQSRQWMQHGQKRWNIMMNRFW